MRLPAAYLALLLAALLSPGCSSSSSGKMSYAQVQALNPGLSADWVLREFPRGKVRRGRDGKVQSISYSVNDPRGRNESLRLEFDAQEVLQKKSYSGPVVRPGGSQAEIRSATPGAPCVTCPPGR